MKKSLTIIAMTLLSYIGLFAQELEAPYNALFNHLAWGFSISTGGIGIDVATTLNSHLQARLGLDLCPPMTLGANVRTSEIGTIKTEDGEIDLNNEMTFDVTPKLTTGSLIFDFYPSKKNSFHISAGLFIGGSYPIKAVNDSYPDEIETLKSVYKYNHSGAAVQPIGIQVGEYLLEPDENGKVYTSFKTKMNVQPYIGIGFGRAVPNYKMSQLTPYNKRLGYSFEIGARFWGSPDIICNGKPVDIENLNAANDKQFLKVIAKTPIYPVIKFRISGKIF